MRLAPGLKILVFHERSSFLIGSADATAAVEQCDQIKITKCL